MICIKEKQLSFQFDSNNNNIDSAFVLTLLIIFKEITMKF